METMRSFKIITPDNKLLSTDFNKDILFIPFLAILKQNIVFLVEVLKKNIKIYGCHLIYRVSLFRIY